MFMILLFRSRKGVDGVQENIVEQIYHPMSEGEQGAQPPVVQLGGAQYGFPSILITRNWQNKV